MVMLIFVDTLLSLDTLQLVLFSREHTVAAYLAGNFFVGMNVDLEVTSPSGSVRTKSQCGRTTLERRTAANLHAFVGCSSS